MTESPVLSHFKGPNHAERSKQYATCDCLPKLLVGFTQDADKTRDSSRVYKCCFVVGVLVDEVPRGAGGISQHSSVITGEKLNQSWNAMQIAHLTESADHSQAKWAANGNPQTSSQ